MRPTECAQSVILYERTKTGEGWGGTAEATETPCVVEGVFIGSPTGEEIAHEMAISGKRWAHTLGIPKGDTHDWEDAVVEFYGRKWRAIGAPVKGIEGLMPFLWGMNVKVEAYG